MSGETETPIAGPFDVPGWGGDKVPHRLVQRPDGPMLQWQAAWSGQWFDCTNRGEREGTAKVAAALYQHVRAAVPSAPSERLRAIAEPTDPPASSWYDPDELIEEAWSLISAVTLATRDWHKDADEWAEKYCNPLVAPAPEVRP